MWQLSLKLDIPYDQAMLSVFTREMKTYPQEYLSSVTQLCPTLCYLEDCSTPGLPVHHQFTEFTQTHVH